MILATFFSNFQDANEHLLNLGHNRAVESDNKIRARNQNQFAGEVLNNQLLDSDFDAAIGGGEAGFFGGLFGRRK